MGASSWLRHPQHNAAIVRPWWRGPGVEPWVCVRTGKPSRRRGPMGPMSGGLEVRQSTGLVGRTMTTEHGACIAQCPLTDPSSSRRQSAEPSAPHHQHVRPLCRRHQDLRSVTLEHGAPHRDRSGGHHLVDHLGERLPSHIRGVGGRRQALEPGMFIRHVPGVHDVEACSHAPGVLRRPAQRLLRFLRRVHTDDDPPRPDTAPVPSTFPSACCATSGMAHLPFTPSELATAPDPGHLDPVEVGLFLTMPMIKTLSVEPKVPPGTSRQGLSRWSRGPGAR